MSDTPSGLLEAVFRGRFTREDTERVAGPERTVLSTITPELTTGEVMSQQITDTSKGAGSVRPFSEIDLNVVQDGPLGAPAVLLVHGLAGSTAWWDPVVAILARNFRVIRVDLRGHGRSPSPRHGYDTATHARSVEAALDRRGRHPV